MSAQPTPIVEDIPYDETLDAMPDEEFNRAKKMSCVRRNSFLLNRAWQSDPAPRRELKVASALFVVARVALRDPVMPGGLRVPNVMAIALGNWYGRSMHLSTSEDVQATKPLGVHDYGLQPAHEKPMRLQLIHHLGANDVLVGYNVGWTLAAIDLVLPASRVVDLGSEPAYQRWCVRLADTRASWRGVLVVRLINSFDRRIPAVRTP